MNIALFASGNGSNVQAIIDAANQGIITENIACLVCDNSDAYVIERAKATKLNVLVLEPRDCKSRKQWEGKILNFLIDNQVDFVVLAGFMRIIGEHLLTHYQGRMINIHPSLLPQFPGRQSINDAFEANVKETGVTIHYVDSGIDTGEIITQESLKIHEDWTFNELKENIHAIEHRLYPITIQQTIDKIKKEGI
ncbi:phosphoribosylglycinamide formyltransferase [Aerococcaceae bacterium WGS1372]